MNKGAETLYPWIQDFLAQGSRALVLEPSGNDIFIVMKKDFLERFSPDDGVVVGGEPLNLRWGKSVCKEVDGWPSWVAEIRLKRVPKGDLHRSLRELSSAVGFKKALN